MAIKDIAMTFFVNPFRYYKVLTPKSSHFQCLAVEHFRAISWYNMFIYQQYVQIFMAEEDKSAFKLLIDEKKRVRKNSKNFCTIVMLQQ